MKDFLEFFRHKSISEYRLIFIVPSKIVIYLYIRCYKRTVGKSSNVDKVSDNVVREKSASCGKDIRSFFKPVSKTKIKSKPSTAGGSIIVLDQIVL